MRSLELFSGAGGLAIGLETAGFHHELVVEWDEDCYRTLLHNKERGVSPMSSWNTIKADVGDIDYSTIQGTLDLIAGGPPCQPFSVGGKHKGQGDHRNMWPEAIRAVRELSPRAFLFENVQGLLRPAFVPYLEYMTLQLELPEICRKKSETWVEHSRRLQQENHRPKSGLGLRYRVFVHPIDAASYGAPQRRRRVIIVGLRGDQKAQWELPQPTHSREALLWDQWVSEEYWNRHQIPSRKRPRLREETRRSVALLEKGGTRPSTLAWRTVRDAIGDLPAPRMASEVFPNHKVWPGARQYAGHTGSSLDEPAKTLKAGDHGVPGGENTLLLGNGSVRYFTIREAARLQGFPDDFIFPVSWTESMRQIGNAVPVQLTANFAQHLAIALDEGRKIRRCRAA